MHLTRASQRRRAAFAVVEILGLCLILKVLVLDRGRNEEKGKERKSAK